VSDPRHIETHLLARNIKHFGEADGTLFTRPEITKLFHYEGTSSYFNMLLKGDYNVENINNLNKTKKTLLSKLINKKNLQYMDNEIILH
jgi:hypothetical protein